MSRDRGCSIVEFEGRCSFVYQPPLHCLWDVEDSAHQAKFQRASLPQSKSNRTINDERPQTESNFRKPEARSVCSYCNVRITDQPDAAAQRRSLNGGNNGFSSPGSRREQAFVDRSEIGGGRRGGFL